MIACSVHLITSPSGTFHVRATNGLSLCGRPLGEESEHRSGSTCAICRRSAAAQGYSIPAAFVRGYPSGTEKANKELVESVRRVLSERGGVR